METFPVSSLDNDRIHERRRRSRLLERARQTRAGVAMYMMLSSVALRLSVQTERDPRVREMRKRILLQRWRILSGDILQTPFPGARLP